GNHVSLEVRNKEVRGFELLPEFIGEGGVQHVLKLEALWALVEFLLNEVVFVESERVCGLTTGSVDTPTAGQGRIIVQCSRDTRGKRASVTLPLLWGGVPTGPDPNLEPSRR